MDDQTVQVISTDDVETEVINTNQVLTLITTEDGIPTSTEVTVLTTTLGDVPLMTTSLGTLAEVPLVTSHPSFVNSHPGVRTVYATSINPSHTGQPVVVGEGRIAVLDTNGVQQTIVVHADPSQLSALTQVDSSEAQPHLISVNLHQTLAPSESERNATSITEEKNEPLPQETSPELQEVEITVLANTNEVAQADQVIISNQSLKGSCEEKTAELCVDAHEIEKSDSFNVNQNKENETEAAETDIRKEVSSLPSDSCVIPDEVVCLVCYQAFLNPKRRKKEGFNDTVHASLVGENKNLSQTEDEQDVTGNTYYGRTLGKFFEISRINMSIVTRRSYKEYEVPICQKCNVNLMGAEQILEKLRCLERELYYIRQQIKEEILTSHLFYKNKENKELAESRRNIPGLIEIIDIVDRIREDIINDGRPPKIPRSIVSGNMVKRPGRKAKKTENNKNTEESVKLNPNAGKVEEKDSLSLEKAIEVPILPSSEVETVAKEKTDGGKQDGEPENDCKEEKPAIRTSFGRLVKRPTYMINEITDDELSELGESSEDNYEEIEVKPDLPSVSVGESSVINDEEMDEEDPAWSPGQGMFISERVGIPPSTSDESDIFSGEDSDAETIPKVKTKKEKKEKKSRKSKPSYKRKTAKRVPALKQEDMNYEVKVIQLDGTELMSFNSTRSGENIGLEPDITQKVMDSQAVIMVKNQLFGKRVQCNHCPRTFTDPHRRDIHIKKKHEGVTKPFECEACQRRFSRQDHLKNHMKRHMRPPKDKIYKPKPSTSEKTHSCEYCKQRFRNKSELSVHTRVHTGEKPYKCDHCAEAFVSALKREFHIEQMHPEVPPIRCEFCNRGFFRQHRLRIHAVSHTGEKTNICELCGKSFSQAAMLRYHQTTHEELNLKQFKCQECNRVFANPQNLKSHMESQHQKMYRHRCPHCERGYTQMSHLRRHLRTHSGEQPFICSYCPKRFTSGAALKIHVRIHTGERPYWCPLCEKGFRSKTKLGRHLKTLIHSGENKDRMKKETVTTEIETVDMNAATATAWTEIVGIITGV